MTIAYDYSYGDYRYEGDIFSCGYEYGDELIIGYGYCGNESIVLYSYESDFGLVEYGFEYGYEYGFGGWKFSLKGVGKFVSGAVKAAGRAIDTAGSLVKKIPIVGAPVNQIFGSAWKIATSPVNMAVAIGKGQRIDRAMMDNLKSNLGEIKAVAPYAQMVVSVVPGIGTGVSAAMGAGMALMNGQPITDALAAGVAGMVPGGPLVSSALQMGYSGVKSAVKGERVNIESLAKTGLGGLGKGLGLPPAATNGVLAGVAMTGNLVRGVPPDVAIAKGAIDGIPVNAQVKAAMHSANNLAQAVARGQRVDRAALVAADKAFEVLPVSNDLKQQVKLGISTGKGILASKNPNEMLSVGLQTGLADKLISSSGISKEAQKALTTGMSVGVGQTKQIQRTIEIANNAGKLIQSGIEQAKTVPAIAAGRKLAGAGTKGFDMGTGIMQMHSSLFDITAVRETIKNPADLKGFDMALSQRIGQVTTKPNPKLSPAARAGQTMTIGMAGYTPESKTAMMKNIAANPSAAVGAKEAVKEVATAREGFIRRILRAIGIVK
jgi:hypothetical protein